MKRKNSIMGMAFFGPALVLLTLFLFLPMLLTLGFSFTDYFALNPELILAARTVRFPKNRPITQRIQNSLHVQSNLFTRRCKITTAVTVRRHTAAYVHHAANQFKPLTDRPGQINPRNTAVYSPPMKHLGIRTQLFRKLIR